MTFPVLSFLKKNCSPVFALLLLATTLHAQQNFSNLRTRTLDARLPSQRLDSLSVMPPLISIFDSASGQPIDFQFFILKNNFLQTDTARLRQAHPDCEKLRVSYRILPFDLAAPVRRLDTAAIRRTLPGGGAEDYIGYDYAPFEPQKPLWETSGLNTAGAYTRGLSFGNAQNLVFNSNLNLQLDGKLGNDLALRAAISDNSVPLQPDGTTRQLQEFDRIFIQLQRKNTALTAGDFDLTRPNGYFQNYFKRVQGASFSDFKIFQNGQKIQNPKSKIQNDTLSYRFAAAVSRGKFARQIIQGREGNQGPYRLQGAEGEQFIIVLAGTEKVFLDGQRLQRGATDDYIVDYNVGEITFTARRLITKDSRLIVEFEYAVQTYLRSTLAGGAAWRHGRGGLHLNIYSEQDSRTAGGAQDLAPAERQSLAQAGDQLRNAYASGVDTLDEGFDPNRVLYRYADTLACGLPARVLVYATHPDSARYAARFTQVAQGQGNYVQVATAANGRVFRWVAPDPATCQPQGNFEPIVRLIAPEQRQMYALGADFQPFKNTELAAEVALTNRDLNRFSPLGNADNLGAGAFLSFRQKIFSEKNSSGWRAQTQGSYEFAGKTFESLNPYRPAEFTRDWNLSSTDPTAQPPARADEHIARGGFSIEKRGIGQARYEYGAFFQKNQYDGGRHFGQLRAGRSGWDFLGEMNLLQTDGLAERTRFSRPKLDVSRSFFKKNGLEKTAVPLPDTLSEDEILKKIESENGVGMPLRSEFLKIGFYAEREKNERQATSADTLNRVSFWYDLFRFYFQMPENQRRTSLGGYVQRRNDFFPTGKNFTQNTLADEANLNGTWRSDATRNHSITQSLNHSLTLRRLRVLAPELTDQRDQTSYLGRVNYALTAWKRALGMTTNYEIGSGQSPKVEFSYVPVNPGEGQYAWIDRNQDSILQVDEMEIAIFSDQARFVRVGVTTPNFIRTNNVELSQSLDLNPRVAWAGRRGWRRWAGRFSLQSNAQIVRRVLAGTRWAWVPLGVPVADSALVALSSSIYNSLFFNRSDPKWSVSLTQNENRNRLVLTTGFDSRAAGEWKLQGRVNLARKFSAEAELATGRRRSDAEFFNNRDYDIGVRELAPQLTWMPSRQFRSVLKYHFQKSENRLADAGQTGGERAQQQDFGLEITWNPAAKTNRTTGFRAATSIRGKFTFADVRFDGQANSAAGYAMLEGLQNGRNFLWSLSVDRQLTKDMQLNISYEGRKTGTFGRLVHLGRATVRAVF